MIHDDRICDLGEGPFWHPGLDQLFWFDILNRRLLTRGANGPQHWDLPEMFSAAGWLGGEEMILASETGLWRFLPSTAELTRICEMEADDPGTRSNDGRADPQGGFWIGTMGKRGGADPARGAIWRYSRGELRKILPGLTIPNAISFAPDGRSACFADTVTQQVMRVALDAEGWPVGSPALYLDLTAEGLFPDGAVFDADGVFWLAQWGASRVAAYGPDGQFLREVAVAAPHSSCPAFGGPGLTTLFCTSAREGLTPAAIAANPQSGMVFAFADVAPGLPSPRVIL